LTCISIAGVWNWRGTNTQGGKVALADWESVAINGRVIYLCFDSDVMTKSDVAQALRRFTAFLEYKHATVQPIYLPAVNGEKVGLDDFLAAHGREALLELAVKTTPPRSTAAGSTAASASRTSRPPAAPCTLAALEHIFREWIPTDDPVPMRAVLATYVANRHLDGDPIWTMLVGGSGIGKTERLVSVAVMEDVVLASSITGPAALLSGTAQKERAKDATGGLLRRVPDGGHLLLKDFTSILEMHRDSRAEILAALREIHDGRWDREVGSDGGKALSWTGRLGLIAGCTSAIDTAHEVIGQMGPRFVLVRLTRDKKIAAAAYRHEGEERVMRAALRTAVAGLLDHLPGQPFDKAAARDPILALACYVALARSPVARRMGGDITLVMDEEAPTRMTKTLVRLWRASGVLGLDEAAAWSLIERVGLDSIPKLRRSILDDLADRVVAATTTEIAEAVRHPTQTTRRTLEDLAAHQMVVRLPTGAGKADRWELASQTREWRDQMTVPLMSGGVEPSPGNPGSTRQYTTSSMPPDISGTVAETRPLRPGEDPEDRYGI
jgi:Domain of unknown function (DUF3854)